MLKFDENLNVKYNATDLKEFGDELGDMYEAAKRSRDELVPRWDQIDKMYKEGLPSTIKKPYPDAPEYPYPIAKPKMDQHRAYVAGSLTKNNPYVIVRAGGPSASQVDSVQSVLHMFMHMANYKKVLKECVNVAQRRGIAIVRTSFVQGLSKQGSIPTLSKIKYDVIDPRNVFTYPSYATEWSDMTFIGHIYSKQRSTVEKLIKNGEYYKVEFDSEDEDSRPGEKQSRNDNAVSPKNERIPLCDIYIHGIHDDPSQIFRIVFNPTRRAILKVEPIPQSEAPYTRLFLHTEENTFFNDTSMGYDLVPVQQWGQDLRNMIMWGSMYNFAPPVVNDGGSLTDQVVRLEPGTMQNISGLGQPWALPTKTELNSFALLLPISERDADSSSHVSQMGTGATMRSDTTATEASYIQQGQTVGVNDDADDFSIGIAELARVTCELLYYNFGHWYPEYADCIPVVSAEDFAKPYWFEANGETPANTPTAVIAQASQILNTLPAVLQSEITLAQLSQGQYVPSLLKYPNLIGGLLRSIIESTQLPSKDLILPGRIEEIESGPTENVEQPGLGISEVLPALLGAQGGGEPSEYEGAGGPDILPYPQG